MNQGLRLLGNAPIANGWRLLRIEWPAAAQPGQWLTLMLDGEAMPLPINHAAEGWLGLLAPPALAPALAALQPSMRYEFSAPVGTAFDLSAVQAPPVLLGSEAGMACALFAAERLTHKPRLVLLGGAQPPPFRPAPSQFMLAGLPAAAIAAAPGLEAQDIPSRIANEMLPGCFEGLVVDLLRLWLASQPQTPLDILASVSGKEAAQLEQLAAAGGHRLQALSRPL
jgi:dihydroorotate dehydrogenase electron transfer subunit